MLTSLLSIARPILLVGQAGNGSGGLIGLLLPLLLIFGVFYLFIYRPQKQREQEHQEMVDNLEKGDRIVTVGGIHGTIRKIDEDSVLAQVDSKGAKLRFDKQAIASLDDDED